MVYQNLVVEMVISSKTVFAYSVGFSYGVWNVQELNVVLYSQLAFLFSWYQNIQIFTFNFIQNFFWSMLFSKSVNHIFLSKPQTAENFISRNILIRVLFVSAVSNNFVKQVMSWQCSGQTNEELVGNLKSKYNFIIWLIIHIYQ